MIEYAMEFRVVGEVADMLLLKRGEPRLLIDVSPDVPGHELSAARKYPTRTTLTVCDPSMIENLRATLEIGQVIEACGVFRQTDYVPHKTTCIDTTFQVQRLEVLGTEARDRSRFKANRRDGAPSVLH